MWVRVAGPKHQRIILFDYDPSRGGEVADGLIEGCSGYLQSDGYQAYEGVSERAGLIHVGCFAQYPELGFILSTNMIRLQ